jgi:hypothetical protein
MPLAISAGECLSGCIRVDLVGKLCAISQALLDWSPCGNDAIINPSDDPGRIHSTAKFRAWDTDRSRLKRVIYGRFERAFETGESRDDSD